MPPYCIATVSSIALLQCLRSERLVQLGRRRQLLRPTFTPHLLSDSERKTTPVAVKKKLEARKKKIGGCGLMRAARDVQISILRPPQRVSRSKQGT